MLTRNRRLLLLAGGFLLVAGLSWSVQRVRPSLAMGLRHHQPGFYHVIKVDDGDTIEVDMGGQTESIRFIGVDTPETHHPTKPVQCYGPQASEFTTKTVDDSWVRLVADVKSGNRDRYARLLRYVYLEDGRLLNLSLVKKGFGFAIRAFPHTKMESFIQAEASAHVHNYGLWGGCEINSSRGYLSTQPQ